MAVVVQILALQIQLGRMKGDVTRGTSKRVEQGASTSPISGVSRLQGKGEMCSLGPGNKDEYSVGLNFIFISYKTV